MEKCLEEFQEKPLGRIPEEFLDKCHGKTHRGYSAYIPGRISSEMMFDDIKKCMH